MIVYTYNLPQELIAQEPARPRDSARLLVYDRNSRQITDAVFRDIDTYLVQHTTLVVNNSKVEHCRWLFADGKIEVFVLQKLDSNTIRAMVRPGRKFKVGKTLQLLDWLEMRILSVDEDGFRTIVLSVPHDDNRLVSYEHIPLPPYIKRDDALAEEYQTVYARSLGSKAAPTAGLHFTADLINKIRQSHDIPEVTLHVGLGTFVPLTQKQITEGRLHAEYYDIAPQVETTLRAATHITAVGTTSTRTLEAWRQSGRVSGFTDIMIKPGYQFSAVNSLITNFHLPGTSLLLLAEAFIGSQEELARVYEHAVTNKYRFYSFGDAMLVI